MSPLLPSSTARQSSVRAVASCRYDRVAEAECSACLPFPGLQASTILIMSFGARLPQIVMNYQRGNSGELSLITCVLNVMGCITRMFTTFVLTKVRRLGLLFSR